MKRYSLILAFFFFSLSANFSQTKNDLINAMQVIFEHPQLERAYQHEVSEGLAIVILASNNLSKRNNKGEQLKSEIRQDDFYYFKRPIKLLFENDDNEYANFQPETFLNFSVSGNEEMLDFFLFCGIKEEQKRYQWSYRLVKKAGQWTLENHSVNSRYLRIDTF